MPKNLSPTASGLSPIRCAIYTRKSTEERLDLEFNSLDAQRAAAESFIASQKSEGWLCLPKHYDDGGFSGGNLDRPAYNELMKDIEAGEIDCVIVYKVDRLSRSLFDFAQTMKTFDKHGVSFVSVTQQFNTTNSMGRLTLNILLSFAQFEREIISERISDKIAAQRQKGFWCGGQQVLGYDVGRTLTLIWKYGSKKSIGTGKLEDDVLTVEYEGAIVEREGKATYTIKSADEILGEFHRKGTKGIGKETLTRQK